MLQQALVELHVSDFGKAIHFYSRLGFSVARQEQNYLVMKKEDCIISFFGGSADRVDNHEFFGKIPKQRSGYNVEVIIPVQNIEQLFKDLQDAVVAPLKQRPWGVKDFRIEDPFGFYLRITEPYNHVGEEDL